MVSKYRKDNCPYCKEASSLTIMEVNDKFFWKICTECSNPIIIYKWHDEPEDQEIAEIVKWALQKFKKRVPDFRRKHVKDHFSFEMVFGKNGKFYYQTKEVFVQCPVCNKVVNLYETRNTKDGIPVCLECWEKSGKGCVTCIPELSELMGETEDERALELAQLQDMDDVEDE